MHNGKAFQKEVSQKTCQYTMFLRLSGIKAKDGINFPLMPKDLQTVTRGVMLCNVLLNGWNYEKI